MKHTLYITSQFPTITETFIAREMAELVNQKHRITIAVLRHRKSPMVSIQKNLIDIPIVRYPFLFPVIIFDIIYASIREPQKFIQCFADLIWNCLARPKYALASIYIFISVCWLFRKIRKKEINLIRAHFLHSEAIAAYWLSNLLRIPYSITTHVVTIRHSEKLIKKIAFNASFITAISKQALNQIKKLGATNPILLRNGVNINQFKYRGPKDRSANPPIILAIGSLLPMKGFDVLIRAIARLEAHGKFYKSIIIGEGSDRGKLELLIQELSLNNIQMIGQMSIEEIKEFLIQATVLVMPSKFSKKGVDGIPTVLIEAMVSGLPVVSTRFVGIPELVIHEFTGLLAEPDDNKDLSIQIERILNDSQLRIDLHKNAIEIIRRDYDLIKCMKILSSEINSFSTKID